ncbi:hypothetical protein [Fibrella forsythiae]|uniref:Outer membrane protein beta-barrel domain-containing protein n=1 Tax=Fibrella forsythiae TaxID=2817061 RepID=A0ABS3JSL7_9BACT|nr:hypothetical protein [Fibrella forsythiae]MBO0953004.1 hypothetical protein [Fibrella forsythiae]
MKSTMLMALLSLQLGSVIAQTIPKNNLFLEAGGNGLFASLNYERQLTNLPQLSLRVGAGLYGEKAAYLSLPVGLNYLIKLANPNAFIDAGFGTTWAQAKGRLFGPETNSSSNRFFSYVPSVGYRRYTASQYMWRVSFTPVINQYGFMPWAGVSLGKGF